MALPGNNIQSIVDIDTWRATNDCILLSKSVLSTYLYIIEVPKKVQDVDVSRNCFDVLKEFPRIVTPLNFTNTWLGYL